MKSLRVACLSALLVVFIAQTAAPEPNSLQMATIADSHAAGWRIVCPPPGSPAIDWAALELQKYLQQISGSKLPIVKRARGKPAFAIGLRPELSPSDRAL